MFTTNSRLLTANAISLINLGFFVKLFYDKKFKALAATLVLMLAIELFKQYYRQKRPLGAKQCDMLLLEGKPTSPGMPSSHVATLVAMMYLTDWSDMHVIAGFMIMSWAQMEKKCHSHYQVLAGGLAGYIFAKFAKPFTH